MNRLQLPLTVGTKLPIAMVGPQTILTMGDIFAPRLGRPDAGGGMRWTIPEIVVCAQRWL
jgi:hypothetical protein